MQPPSKAEMAKPNPHPLQCHPIDQTLSISSTAMNISVEASDGSLAGCPVQSLPSADLSTEPASASSEGFPHGSVTAASWTLVQNSSVEMNQENRDNARLVDIIGLPALTRVFDYLPMKADKRALILVDKSSYERLLPKLYHTISVDIAHYPDCLPAITNLVHKKNRGRQYIRRVIFDASQLRDKSCPPSGVSYLAYLFIENVKWDQLEYFSWPSDYPLTPIDTLTLWEKHEGLSNLEIWNDTLQYRTNNFKNALNQLNKVQSLRISPNDLDGLRHIDKILNHIPIQELHVDLRTYKHKTGGKEDPTGLIRDNITNVLFKYALPLVTCPEFRQLTLKRLVLWEVDLLHSRKSWLKTMRPELLQDLELSNCANTGQLLEKLAILQPKITSLKIFHTSDDKLVAKESLSGSSFDTQLAKFLVELATGLGTWHQRDENNPVIHRLHNLQIKLRWSAMYAEQFFKAVALHASALEILKLDFRPTVDSDPNDSPEAYEQLGTLLTHCNPTHLRQLSIPLQAYPGPKMKYTNPITLCLLQRNASDDYDGNIHNSRIIANLALDTLRKTHKKDLRLRVIAVQNQERDERPTLFVRCEVVVMGRKDEVMVPVSFGEVKKWEEDVDILEAEPMSFGPWGRV